MNNVCQILVGRGGEWEGRGGEGKGGDGRVFVIIVNRLSLAELATAGEMNLYSRRMRLLGILYAGVPA